MVAEQDPPTGGDLPDWLAIDFTFRPPQSFPDVTAMTSVRFVLRPYLRDGGSQSSRRQSVTRV